MIENNLTQERIEKYTRDGIWFNLVLSDLVDRAAAAFPEKVFITDSQKKITYREFSIITKRLAIFLLENGVRKGDRLGVQLPDRGEYFALVVAASRIGAVYIPFNHQFRELDLVPLLDFSKPKVMAIPAHFRGFDYLPMYRDIKSKNSSLKHLLVFGGEGSIAEKGMVSLEAIIEEPLEKKYPEDYLDQFRPDPNDICFILLTSGTTGIPKGAMHTHNTWICGCFTQWAQVAIRPDDIALCLYPMFGTSALVKITGIVFNKASVVMMDKFNGEDSLRLAEKEGVTMILGVAAHLSGMLDAPEFEKYDLGKVRLVWSVGGPVTAALAKEVEERMNCHINLLWGSSEATGHTQTLLTDPEEKRLYTVGRPVPYMDVKAVDSSGREVQQGVPGELLVKGANNFVGYYNNPGLNKEAITPDGWLRTGDMGLFDREGYLKIVGRTKDMILRGGENIYPREIEELLAKHDKIRDIAVVGAPDERLGEIVCACIIPKQGEGIVLDEIVSYLKGKIQMHKIPQRLELFDEFPMTDAGKVIKAELREIIARRSSE